MLADIYAVACLIAWPCMYLACADFTRTFWAYRRQHARRP